MLTCILLRLCGKCALEVSSRSGYYKRSFFCFLRLCAALAQTTQGLISGRLLNSVTGRPIAGATVLYSSSLSNLAGASMSDPSGYYYLPLLSPGFYQIRVNAPHTSRRKCRNIELTVAARLELDFRLRPLSDVWEAGQYNSVFLPGIEDHRDFLSARMSTPANPDRSKRRRAAANRWNPPFPK